MPKPPDENESFLGRWSRHKRAQPIEQEPVEALEPSPDEVEDNALTEEDVAALPSLDDLTPDSDIRAFLQKGVPQALRNAALRRKWMLVPGIRDHHDPAVDYAWDWNTPGGVPGDGVAPSPERAAQMLRELFAPRHDAEAAQAVETQAEVDDAVPEPAVDGAPQQADHAAAPQAVRMSAVNAEPGAEPEPPQPPATSDVVAPVRRRHGGAMPE